jgi:hypothetical protein
LALPEFPQSTEHLLDALWSAAVVPVVVFPAVQAVQLDNPVVVLYDPAAHTVQDV